ncbi:serine/threonine-protein phosphatase with EF-hands 1 [Orycteropus afer afer]|uniref:Serine/threonine-protein phosphatase with EF-hands 1 n=1 Tax=Orycteropus afer afer TaxID=1230840 RepID=A0A8B7B9C6_ORYAF|nr:serine/threonine-protein phosphatase with EF-hands 1 [Orycteropus afer afer]
MGCNISALREYRNTRKAIKAAKIIQKWYRRYSIQLRIREYCALSIFACLEYTDEDSQVQLSDFLTCMLEHYANYYGENPAILTDVVSRLLGGNLQDKDEEDYVKMIDVPDSYDGPRLQFPLTSTDIDLLTDAFRKEKEHGRKILKVLEEVYAWLPIGAIVDSEILVLHGGISESTDLNFLSRLERSKIKSVLMPPIPSGREVTIDFWKNRACGRTSKPEMSIADQLLLREWQQVIDILWSDPRDQKGCYPNKNRGRGCYFGPDVSISFLRNCSKKYLVRSHEYKPAGYEMGHRGKVITVFSASNYHEEGSNPGVYLRLGRCKPPRLIHYRVTRRQALSQRLNVLESSAIRILKESLIARKTDLVRSFKLHDRNATGRISLGQWAFSMKTVMGLNLPWRLMSVRLINTDDNGNVDYMSIFQDVQIENPVQKVHSTIIETVYRYRFDLHIIFDVIDTDHSGFISVDQFRAMWKLFKTHCGVRVDDSQVDELTSKMDLNKDGSIDFKEFLKAFYVVHKCDTLPTSENVALSQD